VDATLRQKLRRVRFSLRLRFEQEQGRPWDADGELVRSYAARQRLEVEYPVVRKVALVGSGELFLRLADSDGVLDKWRAGIGLALGKGAHELSVRYLIEDPLTDGGEVAHVLGLSYDFSR
jgi:hypothetical protein